MDMLESYYEYDTPCTCSQETNIQNRIHGNFGTTKSTVTKKGPEVVNKTITDNRKYTILPPAGADSISAVYLDVDVNPPIWDVDGMKYQGSEITKFPDNWRFAPRGKTTCDYMFNDCIKLESIDLSKFDSSNIKSAVGMFRGCESLTSINLKGFTAPKLDYIEDMFYNCPLLKSIDLHDLVASKFYSMGWVFTSCASLEYLDISNANVSTTTSVYNMFLGCKKLKTIVKGSFAGLKLSLDLSPCVVLSKQSVVDLFDSIGTANSGAKITLASAVYSQLSSDEIKVATDKGWTIASN